jgi:predicted glycosyltransferase
MDYEGQPANHLAFRLADLVLMPAALRNSGVGKQGATRRRTRFYAGFKEEMYLGDFEPDPAVLASLGIERGGRPIVVLRTPPSRATYHQFGNAMFARVLERLGSEANAQIVVLVRHAEQRDAIARLAHANLAVPEHAVDSRSLLYFADLVIGAGGTMTREAALLGVPTYSAFAGAQPAVDRQLECQGRLRRLEDPDALIPVRERTAEPRSIHELRAKAAGLIDTVVETAVGRSAV